MTFEELKTQLPLQGIKECTTWKQLFDLLKKSERLDLLHWGLLRLIDYTIIKANNLTRLLIKGDKTKKLISDILQISEQNKEGFTYSIETNEFLNSGYIVAYEETQNSFGVYGLTFVVSHAKYTEGILGGWFNTEDGNYYFDSCKRFTDKNKALTFAKETKQLAIFDLSTQTEIRL